MTPKTDKEMNEKDRIEAVKNIPRQDLLNTIVILLDDTIKYSKQIDNLESENAKLQKALEGMTRLYAKEHEENAKLKARWEKLKRIRQDLLFTAECIEGHCQKHKCKGEFHWLNNSAGYIRVLCKEMQELEKELKG